MWSGSSPLLDMLPTPSTDGVGEVYQQLKNNLGTTAAQQAESSLQHPDKASILTTACPKNGGQRFAQGALEAGSTSSPMRISAYDWALGRNNMCADGIAQGMMMHSLNDP
jgi:hypothetical protein